MFLFFVVDFWRRLISITDCRAESLWFWGVFAGFFQLGCFYGPTFRLSRNCPQQIRATVVAFYILLLNLVGVAIGVTAAGIYIDHLAAQVRVTLHNGPSMVHGDLWLPFLFFGVGRRFERDKSKLAAVFG